MGLGVFHLAVAVVGLSLVVPGRIGRGFGSSSIMVMVLSMGSVVLLRN